MKSQTDEMDRVRQLLRRQQSSVQGVSESLSAAAASGHGVEGEDHGGNGNGGGGATNKRLTYVKRHELIKPEAAVDREKHCRVMDYNSLHAMLVVSQPTFTSLTPGNPIVLRV